MATATDIRKQRMAVTAGQAVSSPRGLGSIIRDSYFEYAANFIPLALNSTGQTTIAIQSDAHFLCVMTIGTAQTAAGAAIARPDGGSAILLTDGSSQRQLSNIAVPFNALFGTSQRPYVWPFTHLFRANGGITIVINELTGAAQDVRLIFAGFKVPIGAVPELGL